MSRAQLRDLAVVQQKLIKKLAAKVVKLYREKVDDISENNRQHVARRNSI